MMSSRLPLVIFIIFIELTFIIGEWVEITKQKPIFLPPSNTKSNIRILNKSDILDLYQADEMTSSTTPSPQWVEYQRERFNKPHLQTSQQLIVSTENHLKHTAHIVVPANMPTKNGSAIAVLKRNQVVQAKTKLEVKNYEPEIDVGIVEKEPEIFQPKPQVETTSKRDMDHIDVENEDNTGIEDVEVESFDEMDEQQESDAQQNEDESNTLKYPTVKGFFKFLKSIQNSLLKKSGFSIANKIKALKRLRDKLMRTIEEQFTMLWQPRTHGRVKRGLLDESSLNFPPEAALMSINFLTFAVFLIKLVLQVVHIVKSKHYTLTGLNMNNEVVKTSSRS